MKSKQLKYNCLVAIIALIESKQKQAGDGNDITITSDEADKLISKPLGDLSEDIYSDILQEEEFDC